MKRPLKICRSRSRPILRSRARTSCWLRLTARSDERRKRRRKCNSSASSRKARARKPRSAQSDCWKKLRTRSIRRRARAIQRRGAIKFSFRFFVQSFFAVNLSQHVMKRSALRRERDGLLQFGLRFRELIEMRVGFAQQLMRPRLLGGDFGGPEEIQEGGIRLILLQK